MNKKFFSSIGETHIKIFTIILLPLAMFTSVNVNSHDVSERVEVECSHQYTTVYEKFLSNVNYTFSVNNLSAHLELGNKGTINAIAEIKSDSGRIFKQAVSFGYTYDKKEGLNLPLQNWNRPVSQVIIPEEFKEEFGAFPSLKCYFLK